MRLFYKSSPLTTKSAFQSSSKISSLKIFYIISVIILISVNYRLYAQDPFWEFYSLPGQWVSQIKIDRQNNFYAVCDSGGVKNLFRSNDALTWESILPPTDTQGSFLLLIDTTNSLYDKIYVLKQVRNYPNIIDSLFYSTDSGEVWNLLPIPSDLSNGLFFVSEIAVNLYGDLYIPARNNILFTTNNGATWEIINPPSEYDSRFLQIDKEGNIYTTVTLPYPYGGFYESIYKSENNGLTWGFDLSSWAHGEEFTAFETLPTGELYTGAWADWDGLLYFKDSPGDSWHVINNFDAPVSMVINRYSYIYVVSSQVPSEYSPDYGSTWYKFDNKTLNIYDLAVDQGGYLYAATYPSGVYRSKESTLPIINQKSIQFSEQAVYDTTISQISLFNPFNSMLTIDSVKTVSNNFSVGFNGQIILEPADSQIIDINFNPQSYGSFKDTATIYSNLKIERIYLAGNSSEPELEIYPGIWHNHLNFGSVYVDSTQTKSFQIINTSVNFLEIDSIYTHIRQFSFTSYDFPLFIVSDSIHLDISFTPDSNKHFIDTLFIINNVTGLPYIIELIGIGVEPVKVKNTELQISTYRLFDNYPNPFNPRTIIKYQIPEFTNVKISVYNVLGKEIQNLVQQEKPAGTYEVEFDGTNLPSGVYFYRIETGKYSDTKKFLLLK